MARRRVNGARLASTIGRSQAYVSRRLTGETAFDLDDLERIADVLGVKVADLLPRDGANNTARYLHLTERRSKRARRPADNRPSDRPRSSRTRAIHRTAYLPRPAGQIAA